MVTRRTVSGTIDGMGARDLPGDRARPPDVLLDELRLRLERLDANHPSGPGERRAGADRARAAGVPDVPDEDDLPEDDDVPDQDDAPGGDEAARQDRADGSDEPGPAARTGKPEARRPGLAGLAPQAEPYRPWFMSGEDGVPWFAGPR
jgi:hypothetical protein